MCRLGDARDAVFGLDQYVVDVVARAGRDVKAPLERYGKRCCRYRPNRAIEMPVRTHRGAA